MTTTASMTRLEPSAVEAQVLEIVRVLLRETGREEAADSVTLHSSFEQDLGIGSMGLVELMVRCESRFEVELPDRIAEQAGTPAAWVKAILEGGQEITTSAAYRITPPRLDALGEPTAAKTLVEVLVQHAEADPGRVQIHLLETDSGQGITYGRLYEEACAVAGGLAGQGLRRNDTVAIMLPSSAEFFFAFFGVMLAGGIPVPAYPPTRPDRIEDYVRRQIVILRNAGIRFMISFDRIKPVVQILRVNLPNLAEVTTVDALRRSRARLGAGSVKPAETALLQYTSGSTGLPKGVVLRHANLLATIRAIGTAVEVRPGDAVVSWLPLYSDLGLVGTWLFSLYYAIPITILSPLDFLQRPERWLRAIHESRGTLSAAPNYAYELCARRIPAWTLEGIDLSCWRTAVNAGEPVLPETVDRFTERFRPYGFHPESMLPCFGLAESSVALTMPPVNRLPVRDRVKRTPLETAGKAEPAAADDPSALCYFSAGRPVEGQHIRIVDEHNTEVGERVVGRLQFRGEATTPGYHRNNEATAAAVTSDDWVDAGDYGYLAGGEFHFTGRSKESIIKAGRSMSPLDVEGAVSSLAGVQPGSAVVFGAPDRASGTEQLIVAAESRATSQEEYRRIETEIVRLVDTLLGMPPDSIQLVEPDSLPRTANGKIRRNEIRSLYLKGKLPSGGRPPWYQIVKLRWENLGALFGLGMRRVRASLVRVGTSSLAAVVARAGGVWVRLTGNRRTVKTASRWILRLHGQRYSVQGAPLLEAEGPAVLVANRSGMLDPLVVATAIPGEIRFAEISALSGLPPSLAFLLRPLVLGHADNNLTPAAGVLHQRISRALQKGRTVLLFPDSPIGAPVARSRFRLDAFRAGADQTAPLHPTAIRERAQHTQPGERARVRKVTMIIIREPVENGDRGDLFGLRHRVREAIGEYHA